MKHTIQRAHTWSLGTPWIGMNKLWAISGLPLLRDNLPCFSGFLWGSFLFLKELGTCHLAFWNLVLISNCPSGESNPLILTEKHVWELCSSVYYHHTPNTLTRFTLRPLSQAVCFVYNAFFLYTPSSNRKQLLTPTDSSQTQDIYMISSLTLLSQMYKGGIEKQPGFKGRAEFKDA